MKNVISMRANDKEMTLGQGFEAFIKMKTIDNYFVHHMPLK